MKDGFILHLDYLNREEFSAEEIGLLTIAMCEYCEDGTEPKFKDRAMRTEWKRIKARMDADEEAYAEKCRKNKENGAKGGRPKTERFSEETEKTERFLEKPKKPDIDIDLDIDIESDIKEKGTPKGVPKEKAQKRFTHPTLEEVKAYCEERKNGIDPQHFIDYYASQKWKKANGQPLTDWKAGVRTWERKDKEDAETARSGTNNRFNNFEQRQNDMSEIEKRMMQRRVAR